jgi:hypothetical protein
MPGAQFQALMAPPSTQVPAQIFAPSVALATDQPGNGGSALRIVAKTLTGGGTQVRVTFAAGTTAIFAANHCSIAKVNVATAPNCDATPIELKFGGVSGFSIAANSSIVSDWLPFVVSAADKLMVIFDCGASADIILSTGQTNADAYALASSASFNLATVSGFAAHLGSDYSVSKIEAK